MSALLSILLAVVPPVPTRTETVVEKIHGVEVSDPYRWLEKGDAAEVAGWTEKQNAIMRKALDPVPGRKWIEERLWKLHEIGSLGGPGAKGEGKGTRHFYARPTREHRHAGRVRWTGGRRPRTASWWPTGSAPTATRTRRCGCAT